MRVDRDAVWRGVLVGGAIATPAGIIAFLGGDGATGSVPAWASVLALVAIAGLGVGAAVAARAQRLNMPLQHGMIAAIVVFAVIQGFGIIRRAIAGDTIAWSRIASSTLLALVAGAVGGALGGRTRSAKPS
jgi:hypothetical protein